jgi:hypothetical protein
MDPAACTTDLCSPAVAPDGWVGFQPLEVVVTLVGGTVCALASCSGS